MAAALMVAGTLPASALSDLWDLPPVNYSASEAHDPLTLGFQHLAPHQTVGLNGRQRLQRVLDHLRIPKESQILVFSKTSKQNPLISPTTPRAIYFHENAYVGYVPGGDIEAIVHDPALGAVFHLIHASDPGQPIQLTRETSSCLSCHGTARTGGVPGILVRSVFPDQSGRPILPFGSVSVDDRTPLPERWGGYYVTGQSPLPHRGNRTYQASETPDRSTPPISLKSLAGRIETGRYLTETSDIVALMVLEHQCRLHNLIASASLQHRRSLWLRQALDPGAGPGEQQARLMREAARSLADALLFCDEAEIGEGVEGSPEFQSAFAKRFPKSRSGRSLADFRLHGRLFKNRCSFMIYSKVFASAPPALRQEVIRQLRTRLATDNEGDPHITLSERRRIVEILKDTYPAWNAAG